MSISAEQQILEIVQKYGDDTAYWRFVENFKNTVGFQATGNNEDKNAALLQECARQYEYIRTEHPDYFRDLTERKGDELSVLAGIVDWAVVKNLPMMHFAGINSKNFAASIQAKRAEETADIASSTKEVAEDAVDKKVSQAKTSDPYKARFTLDELMEQAVRNYEAKLGHVIRVREYANATGYFQGTREAEDGSRYDLAVVMPTDKREISIEDRDHEGFPYVRGTWSLKFMTGPLSGQTGFTHSTELYADGSVGSNIMLDQKGGYSKLSQTDLVFLAWATAKELSEEHGYVAACSGYEGETNSQKQIQLDPPALVTFERFDIERFRVHSSDPAYKIETYEKGVDAIDWPADFSSDDPRLKDFRSMYSYVPTFLSDGRIVPGEVLQSYDPKCDLDKEPTSVVFR